MTEITYDTAAKLLEVSPRQVRRVFKAHRVSAIRRGHRTVSFDLEKILQLKKELRAEAIKRGLILATGKTSNRKN
jgi:hypothetical protein